jgi:glutaredoxin
MLALLNRLVRRRPTSKLAFTVYTRAQCCCCHTALDQLRAAQRRHGFTLETIDVDTDPALVAQYGLSVPVVAVDGKVRFKGVVNPALLERLFIAEQQSGLPRDE